MQGVGFRLPASQEQEWVDVYNITERNLCAQSCFEIIKKGRENSQIRIDGFYDYEHLGYGVYTDRKELSGDYDVYNCGRLVCKVRMTGAGYQDGNYVQRIRVGERQFYFFRETNDTAKLKAVLQGYFWEKDRKATR